MSKSGPGIADRVVESFFKRRADGWLFAAPTLWPRKTYLLTDEQKARLVSPLRRMWWVQTAVGLAVAIGLVTLVQDQPILIQAIELGTAVVAMFIMAAVYTAIVITPRLAGIPATKERIPFSEKFKAGATVLPKGFIIAGGVISLLFVLLGLTVGLVEGWDATIILSTAFFGGLMLLYVAFFYFARQRANPQK